MENERRKIIEDALSVIDTGDRQLNYGKPEDNFSRISMYWNDFCGISRLKSYDVAIMMILMKISRLQNTPNHRDSWLDIIGYAACGWQCAEKDCNNDKSYKIDI